MKRRQPPPDWKALRQVAFMQRGYFTTRQAAAAGFTVPLLCHHVRIGTVDRACRGIYRIGYGTFVPEENAVVAALWAGDAGTISHEAALVLLGLAESPSFALAPVQLTVPTAWRHRRFRRPPGVELCFRGVPEVDRLWCGWGYVTGFLRTLQDCASSWIDVKVLREAARRALALGAVSEIEVRLTLGWRLRG